MPEKIYRYWNKRHIDNQEPLYYAKKELAAVVGWGGVQIFNPDIDIVELCCEYAKAIQGYSCGQCIPCSIGTKVIHDIFERIKNGYGKEEDLETIKALSRTISMTSMCQVGQGSTPAFIHIIENFTDSLLNAIKNSEQKESSAFYDSIITAPCIQACPIHLNIPKYIEEIRSGRFEVSLDVIRERLPLPATVGRVCARPCESNCRRGLIDEPLQIRHLKRFVADFEMERGKAPDYKRGEQKNLKIAIVGAGPAGLTCAYFLSLKGYDVTIFEALHEPGGMAAVGIPDYRLPREILKREVANIEKLGVKILYGKSLGVDFSVDDLEKDGFKGIFLSLGCHRHKKLGIEGEDRNFKGYVPGIYFLRNINLGEEVPTGKKMVVIGGGNVAMDSVRTALRVGFEEAHLIYRRSRKEMPADETEIKDAEAEGVRFHFLSAPKRIIGENEKIKGLECFKMELGEPDASGRRKPVPVPDSEFIIETDVIVPTIGQESDYACLGNISGVEITKIGSIVVDENLMTKREGIFAGGDCVTGPDTLIRACAQGRLSALKIDKYLTEGRPEPFKEEIDEAFINKLEVFEPSENMQVPGDASRVSVKHEPPIERRKDFREVEKGYTTEEAITEAKRCLRCYRVVTYAYKNQ
jgi:formate dehydrogenase beta subunit